MQQIEAARSVQGEGGSEAKLPNHPFVPFRQIFKNIAEKHIASAIGRRLFLLFTSLWYWLSGIARPERRIGEAFAGGENGYAVRYKRFPTLYSPEFSASCLLQHTEDEDPARKATKLIVAALRFRQRMQSGSEQSDYEGAHQLDMQRYGLVFSRLLMATLQDGAPSFELVERPASDHIIVAIDGVYYKLTALREQQILPTATIYQQVCAILADARTQLDSGQTSDRFPFGLFTALNTKETIRLFSELRARCPAALQDLDDAVFLLAIDLHDCPRSVERATRVIHVQNFHSRDYRRSMQLVVTGNGRAGVIGDPVSGLGGSFVPKFLDDLAKQGPVLDNELRAAPEPLSGGPIFSRLRFDPEFLTERREQVEKIEQKIRAQIYPSGYDTVFRIEGIGKADFAPFHVSMDGVFHAALHLTFKRCFGRVPEIGNFISLRSVAHGEIHRYNSTTSQMRTFAEAPSRQAAQAALSAHKALVKETKKATEEFYQCSMMIWTLFNRREIGMVSSVFIFLLLTLFVKNFRRRFVSQDMWVSHIQEYPGLALTGRPGIKMSYLDAPALAGHYLIFDDHIILCFVSNPGRKSYCGQERRFVSQLQLSLREIHKLLKT